MRTPVPTIKKSKKKRKKSSGPRNFLESKLNHPPHFKYKTNLILKAVKVEQYLGIGKKGYHEYRIFPEYCFNSEKHLPKWIYNGTSDIMFWGSQCGRHSIAWYNNVCYAIMGVTSKTRKVKSVKSSPIYNNCIETIAKILYCQKVDLDTSVVQWIEEKIGEFLLKK